MKSFFKYIAILLTIGMANSTLAATKKKAAAPALTVNAVNRLTGEVKKLNYAKEADRFKGQMNVLEGVKQLQAFSKLSHATTSRLAVFRSLLEMSRESMPYDGEGELADVLANTLRHDRQLSKTYNSYVKSLNQKHGAEFCKSENFKKSVKEQLCMQGLGITGQDTGSKTKKAEKCVQRFDFDACLKNH